MGEGLEDPTGVPGSLRRWFVVHFVADALFAAPLLVAPAFTLGLFGWSAVDPLATRLVGAALVGIGVESLLGRNASRDSFRTMLRLKVLWSVTANVGIALSIAEGAPWGAWVFQGIFLVFSSLWIRYALLLGRASEAPDPGRAR
jgi:hypothetical protein